MHDRFASPPLKASGDWKVVLDLVPYLLEYRVRMVLALVFLVLAKVATVLVPVALKHVINALEPAAAQATPVVVMVALPLAMLVAYGVLRFCAVLFNELRDAVFGRVAERALTRIGLRVFNHLHRLDLEYHLSRRTGGLSRDIERGTTSTSFLLRSFVFSLIPIAVEMLLVILILAVQFDWRYVVLTLGCVVVYMLFTVWVTTWRTGYVRLANEKDSQANTRAVDSLLNYETVKYFNNEQYEAEHYAQDLEARENAKVANQFSLSVLNTGQGLIIAVAVTGIMLLAAQQMVHGLITLGDLAMVNAFLIQVFIPLNSLGFIYRETRRCFADVEAMFDIMEIPPRVLDRPGALELPATEDGVHFRNVNFSYDGERTILHDVSFAIPAGKKLAIVGSSGSGKSTIARLLFRFYDVNAGSICIGNTDIRDATQDSLRRAIGVVPQDTVLFNDSILANIRYGNTQASMEDVERAVRLANLADFIARLPKGYDTVVGERGLKVSGGEKQRIAIARTILKNPRILIYDEATSSLDSANEKQILAALNDVAQRHTTLVIAHRLSTIVDADDILVLEHGRVVEQGSHEALLRLGGVYQQLWQLQQHEA